MPIRDWRELQYLNSQRQQGNEVDTESENLAGDIPLAVDVNPAPMDDELAGYLSGRTNKAQRIADIQRARQEYLDERYAQEEEDRQNPERSGYGAYKHDKDIPYDVWRENPAEARAKIQSPGAQILNGAIKMGITGATTFLDNTVGLIDGILNVAIDKDITGVSKEGRSFIDTPFAQQMQAMRDWSDRVFPNYRTEEEQADADQWWKHLNANFWGDTFLKNFGFTIGAGLSGAAYAKGFRLAQGKVVNKAYKAALAAAGGDAEAEAAFRSVLQGAQMQSPKKIYDTFSSVEKSFHRLAAESQIVGGIGGALGESRTEAINAAREFHDDYTLYLEEQYERGKQELAQSILNNPDYIFYQDQYDGFGNYVGTQPQLNEAGQLAWEKGVEDLQNDYKEKVGAVEREAKQLANTTFALNMPILTLSNMVMFGRMFSGGYRTQAKTKVRGKFGDYKQSGSIAGIAGRTLLNPLSEGMEELGQKVVSEGAKYIADNNMASFHNAKYDNQAIRGVSDILMGVLSNAGDVLVDPKSWEEFAVGFLTGAIGMPTRHGWAGGIYGGVKEGLDARNQSRDAVTRMNERIASKEFQDLWGGLVRHKRYDISKEEDLEHKDEFAWHNDDFKQLMSDIMMFADTGRLNELEAYVDSFARVTPDNIQALRSLISDETNEADPTMSNMTDAQVANWLHERAEEAKKAIRQYRSFHDSIDFLSFGSSDPEAINELVYTQAQLKNFEDRYLRLYNEVADALRPTINNIAHETDSSGNPTQRALEAQELLASENGLRSLFGGPALDIHGRAQDENPSDMAFVAAAIDAAQQARALSELEVWGAFVGPNAELKTKVEDLQKIVTARQNYYTKLFDPRGRSFAERMQDDVRNPEEVVDEVDAEARTKQVNEIMDKLQFVNSFKDFYDATDVEFDDPETEKLLNERIAADPNLKKYQDIQDSINSFVSDVASDINNLLDNNTDAILVPVMDEIEAAIGEVLSPDELYNLTTSLPDDANHPLEIAKSLLDKLSGNEKAYKLVRNILETRLADREQAAELGPVPTFEAPDEGSSGGGGAQSGTGGGMKAIDAAKLALEAITDYESTLLQKFIDSNFEDYPGLTEEEMSELTALAEQRKQRLMKDAGLIAGEDDGSGVSALNAGKEGKLKRKRNEDYQKMREQAIDGSPNPLPIYNQSLLPYGIATVYNPTNPGLVATRDWLMRHNVQDFIDSGALAALERAYREDGEKLPIYFLANPHYIENDEENRRENPFVVPNTSKSRKKNDPATSPNLVLAIEMNDRNRDILELYSSIFEGKTLTVQEGDKSNQYQVIGFINSPTEEQTKEMSEKEKRVVKSIRTIWSYAIAQDIWPRYQKDIESGFNTMDKAGKWYVAQTHPRGSEGADLTTGERISTTLNYIMSGRNETRKMRELKNGETPEDIAYEKIPLSQSLKEYLSYGGEVHFALQTGSGVQYSSIDAPSLESTPITPPSGSLWMATREANGAWAWTYITIPKANEVLSSVSEEFKPLKEEMEKSLQVVFAPIAVNLNDAEFKAEMVKRRNAWKQVSKWFYLGDGNTSRVYKDSDGLMKVSVGDNICITPGEVFDALSGGKFVFQVDASDVQNWSSVPINALDTLIQCGILRSEMYSFIRKGANIGINLMSDRDADNQEVTLHIEEEDLPVARTAQGIRAVSFGAREQGYSNIRIFEKGYRLMDDGKVYRMTTRNRQGSEVTDATTIAQVKALAELMFPELNTGSAYPGRHWILETELNYTELYEREIDGIKVHIQKQGRSGAYELIYSPEYWDAIVKVSREIKPNFKQETEPELTEQEIGGLYDKMMGKEEGGGVIYMSDEEILLGNGKKKKKGAISSVKTVREAVIEEAKDEEKDNCGWE